MIINNCIYNNKFSKYFNNINCIIYENMPVYESSHYIYIQSNESKILNNLFENNILDINNFCFYYLKGINTHDKTEYALVLYDMEYNHRFIFDLMSYLDLPLIHYETKNMLPFLSNKIEEAYIEYLYNNIEEFNHINEKNIEIISNCLNYLNKYRVFKN